jgi:hypothetical protein
MKNPYPGLPYELVLPYVVDISIYHPISNLGLLEHINRAGIILFDRVSADVHL